MQEKRKKSLSRNQMFFVICAAFFLNDVGMIAAFYLSAAEAEKSIIYIQIILAVLIGFVIFFIAVSKAFELWSCGKKRELKEQLGILDWTENTEMDEMPETQWDALTGVLNCSAIEKKVQMYMSEFPEGKHVMILIKADQMQKLNDQFGRKTGDQILVNTAEVFRNSLRSNDLIGRVSGDSFVIFLPKIGDYPQILRQKIQKIRTQMEQIYDPYGVRLLLELAVFPEQGMSYRELLKKTQDRILEHKKELDEKEET